jgi:hypothetical protein
MCLLTLYKALICHSIHVMFLCHIKNHVHTYTHNHVHTYTHILGIVLKSIRKYPIYGSPLSSTPNIHHKIYHRDNLITI